MIERKCLKCGTWNKDEDYCQSCNEPLSPRAIDKAESEKRKQILANTKPSKLDLWMKRAKNHKYGIVRFSYKILYGCGVMATLFGAIFAWLAALANA